MKASAKTTILKNKAKTVLAGKYYAVIMAVFFAAMFSLLINRLALALLSSANSLGFARSGAVILVLSYLIPYLFSIVLNVISVGICFFYLNLCTGNPVFTFQLLYGFSRDFEKSIKLSAVVTTVSFVCTLPVNILLDVTSAYYGTYKLAVFALPVSLVLIVLQIIFLIAYFYVSLSLSQVFYLMLDYPDLSASDIVKTSMKIMKGKKLQLFYLQLSFLPLYLVAILSFGVGLLWVLPYRNTAFTLFYLDVMKPTDPTYQP